MHRISYLIGVVVLILINPSALPSQKDSILIDTNEVNSKLDSFINYAPDLTAVITANSTVLFDHGPLNQLSSETLELNFHRPYDAILNKIPGVIMQSGAINTNRISIRGIGNRSSFSTTKLKAYLDDIPLTTGIGETTIEDIDISLLESITVSKGPTEVEYGSNLGGMVHLNTASHATKNSWTLRSHLGSFGTYQLANTLELKLKASSLWLGQQYLHSDGFRDNNEYDRWHFFALYKKKQQKSEFSIFANHIDLAAEIPSALNINDFISDPRKAADNWNAVNGRENYSRSRLAINHRLNLKDSTRLSTTISGQLYDSYEVRPFNILDDALVNLDTRISLDGIHLGNSGLKLKTGFELFYEEYNFTIFESLAGEQGLQEDEKKDQRSALNLFFQAHKSMPNWSWTLGASAQWYRFNRTELGVLDESILNFDLDLYPQFTLSYLGLKNKKLQFILSRGISIPNFEESLLPDGQLNPDIAVESGWNSELVFQYNGPLYNSQFTAQGYAMYITDMLVARRTAQDAFFSINAGSAWMRGAELSYRQILKITPKTDIEMQLDYCFTWHRFGNFIDDQMDFSGNAI
ncbi:MAG: TonB-dependent receptor plug domain-containing protein, partial [Saprospiraceae bacterium]|nr:TonB-dependent receptor plug domain-containing protein [Saprospiraceae bacterium]